MKGEELYKCFPETMRAEARRILSRRGGEVSEIRIRAHGRCSVTVGSEKLFLSSSPDARELSELLLSLSDGAEYSRRDEICAGYITLKGGVRVGIAGEAKYEGGVLIGKKGVSSLVFRIPTVSESDCIDEIYKAFLLSKRGLLIYSPPGGGKTTALRSLAVRIASGRSPLSAAVIDERKEISKALEDLECRTALDVLSGYKRHDGMEIALRSLAPEVIILDEIGGREEAEGLLDFMRCGVRIVATAHADSISDLRTRRSTRPFIESEIFDIVCGIRREGKGRVALIEEI